MTAKKLICGASFAFFILASSLNAQVIVDDSFADGNFAKTGTLDTNWWTSSSSSGKEISVGSLGLVSGSSGRGIHTIFPEQTLGNVGDTLKATYTFTTPATIGSSGSSFRVGLFDGLGQAGLDADVAASSNPMTGPGPNALYGWGTAVVAGGVAGPGTQALPGYMLTIDVNTVDGSSMNNSDMSFREHTQGPFGTGRLMGTTSNFSTVGSSGPDGEYLFAPNTQYTGSFEVERMNATEFELTTTLDGSTHSVVDAFDSDKFSMLGFHVNSNIFGTSNSAGDADNGIDFSNIKIEVTPIPEPNAGLLSLICLLGLGLRRR